MLEGTDDCQRYLCAVGRNWGEEGGASTRFFIILAMNLENAKLYLISNITRNPKSSGVNF